MPPVSMRYEPFSSSTVCYPRSTGTALQIPISRAGVPPVSMRYEPFSSSAVCYPRSTGTALQIPIYRAGVPPVSMRYEPFSSSAVCYPRSTGNCAANSSLWSNLKNLCFHGRQSVRGIPKGERWERRQWRIQRPERCAPAGAMQASNRPKGSS